MSGAFPLGRHMEPHYSDEAVTLYHGDCIDVLRELPDCSVDSVVTDPPYGLEFMGKEWDRFDQDNGWRRRVKDASDDPTKDWGVFNRTASRSPHLFVAGSGFQLWCQDWAAECLRVLKPGGHLLAFGGTRTWHRLAVAIEDAGFEIRDSIAWMYGSGFPKSLDVSKAIDKQRDDRADILCVTAEIARLRDEAGLTNRDLDDAFGFAGMAGHWTSTKSQPAVPRVEQWAVLRDMLNPDPWLDDEVWRLNGRKGSPGEAWAMRPVVGERDVPVGHAFAGDTYGGDSSNKVVDITAPATPDAARWQGWGTALKPAHEPIVVARKPLIGTVAANVLEHGTGGLNIDGCRIGSGTGESRTYERSDMRGGNYGQDKEAYADRPKITVTSVDKGRWPANVVLDEDQAAALDEQSGVSKSTTGVTPALGRSGGILGQAKPRPDAGAPMGYADTGGASRFFYVAKAPAKERPKVDGIAHPTVKPLTLMRWLCRLVTPPGGVILEPFAGSGTTVQAAVAEGFRCIAIEREDDYLPLILSRLTPDDQEPDDGQLTLDASA